MDVYYTSEDNQQSVLIEIYQGASSKASDNTKLGEFTLSGLPKGKKRTIKIDVFFSLDSNSILDCTATLTNNNDIKNSLTVTLSKNSLLSKEEFTKGLESNKKYELLLTDKKEKLNKIALLEIRLSEVSEGIKNKNEELPSVLVQQITEYVDKTNQWLADSRKNLQNVTLLQFDEKLSSLERICTPARLNNKP